MKKALLFTFIVVAAFAAYYFLVAKKKKVTDKKKDSGKTVSDSSISNSTVPTRPMVEAVESVPNSEPPVMYDTKPSEPEIQPAAPKTISRDAEPAPTVNREAPLSEYTPTVKWTLSQSPITTKPNQVAGGITQGLRIKNYDGRDHALGNDGKVYIWENSRWTLKK